MRRPSPIKINAGNDNKKNVSDPNQKSQKC